MNSLMNRVFMFFRRFKKLVKLIDKETKMKYVVKSVLGALLISSLILLLPVLVIVNMFIYTKLTLFLAILLVIMVMAWGFLYYYFYYKLLKNYHPKLEEYNTLLPQLVESSLVSLFFMFLGIIILAIVL
ncbi:MAG: hypothetical protein CVV57_08660 [Tenericutes bacterium HGW-Tenericutes-2]|nr:MAG: hypothetical protein CVV57_08660 [Tenericutes bacterium HGW-Tenericutes-2]